MKKLEKVTIKELEEAKKSSKPFVVTNAYIWEHTLHVTVKPSRRYKEHEFRLLWDGTQMESNPVQIRLTLVHQTNVDPVEEEIESKELQFVLSHLLNHGVVLDLKGWEELINY